MRAKDRDVLEMCLENGLNRGWNRAHKHIDDPSEDAIITAQFEAIMNEIDTWFDYDREPECQ